MEHRPERTPEHNSRNAAAPVVGRGIDRNLATSADRADYLVELSNIVRRTDFGGPAARSLHRLGLVVDALVRVTGDRDVAVYCVADRSLLGGRREFTEPGDAPTLARWVAEGLVEEVPDADERVLEIAGMTGIQVVTGDYYDDHRIEHPWIQGNTWQFLRPEAVSRGAVRLAPLDMGHRTGAEISKKMELSVLKKQGLLTMRPQTAGRGGRTGLALPGRAVRPLQRAPRRAGDAAADAWRRADLRTARHPAARRRGPAGGRPGEAGPGRGVRGPVHPRRGRAHRGRPRPRGGGRPRAGRAAARRARRPGQPCGTCCSRCAAAPWWCGTPVRTAAGSGWPGDAGTSARGSRSRRGSTGRSDRATRSNSPRAWC